MVLSYLFHQPIIIWCIDTRMRILHLAYQWCGPLTLRRLWEVQIWGWLSSTQRWHCPPWVMRINQSNALPKSRGLMSLSKEKTGSYDIKMTGVLMEDDLCVAEVSCTKAVEDQHDKCHGGGREESGREYVCGCGGGEEGNCVHFCFARGHQSASSRYCTMSHVFSRCW